MFQGKVQMEPKIEEKKAFRVVGVVTHGTPDKMNFGEIWEKQYMPFDDRVKPSSVDQAYYGVWFGPAPDGLLDYMAGMAVGQMDEVPDGLEMREVPSAQYAIFECSVETIGKTYEEAYQRWLPSSKMERDMLAPDIEYYPANTETARPPAKILIPVKPVK
jgi:AraC family transcriptional regulator